MDMAAYFALPMPVRQAARVSTPASVAAETEERRRSEMRSSLSAEGRVEYKIFTAGRASKNSPAAHGTVKASVNKRE